MRLGLGGWAGGEAGTSEGCQGLRSCAESKERRGRGLSGPAVGDPHHTVWNREVMVQMDLSLLTADQDGRALGYEGGPVSLQWPSEAEERARECESGTAGHCWT